MYLTVKFYNLSRVPDDSVYMGDRDFDFQIDRMPVNVKEKLAEYTEMILRKFIKKLDILKKLWQRKEVRKNETDNI